MSTLSGTAVDIENPTGLANGGFEYYVVSAIFPEDQVPGWSTKLNDTSASGGATGNSIERHIASTYGPDGWHTALDIWYVVPRYDYRTGQRNSLIILLCPSFRSGSQQLQFSLGSPNGCLVEQVNTVETGSWVEFTNTYTVPAGQYVTRFGYKALYPPVVRLVISLMALILAVCLWHRITEMRLKAY